MECFDENDIPIPAGHTREVIEGSEIFEVSPTEEARRLHEHIRRRIEAAQGSSD